MQIGDMYRNDSSGDWWQITQIGPHSVFLERKGKAAEVTFAQLRKFYTKVD